MMTRIIMLALVLLGVNCVARAQTKGGVVAEAPAKTRCALVRDGEIVEYREIVKDDLTAEDGCWPDAPQKGVAWMPAPEPVKPTFDPDTQELGEPVIAVEGDKISTTIPVIDKPPPPPPPPPPPHDPIELALCDQENRLIKLEGGTAVDCNKFIDKLRGIND
jgi:hypothetical protein